MQINDAYEGQDVYLTEEGAEWLNENYDIVCDSYDCTIRSIDHSDDTILIDITDEDGDVHEIWVRPDRLEAAPGGGTFSNEIAKLFGA